MTHDEGWAEPKVTAVLVLADGTVLEGEGFGATGTAVGEVCFNTAMTGYEEILTDPSYSKQILTFTFPHVGNVGTNDQDIESLNLAAATGAIGCVVHAAVTGPSNYRASLHFDEWLKRRGIIGLAGIDTRALTALVRDKGMPNAVIAHDPSTARSTSRRAARPKRAGWPGIDGMDLVPGRRHDVATSTTGIETSVGRWARLVTASRRRSSKHHVVAIDYGIKRNILRLLADAGCSVTVVPPSASAEEIMAMKPDGVFLSNGPGDPAATGAYAVPTIQGHARDRSCRCSASASATRCSALAIGATHGENVTRAITAPIIR